LTELTVGILSENTSGWLQYKKKEMKRQRKKERKKEIRMFNNMTNIQFKSWINLLLEALCLIPVGDNE
jgi:truncated hemoglobin YjbI